jgi:hypothetical protein
MDFANIPQTAPTMPSGFAAQGNLQAMSHDRETEIDVLIGKGLLSSEMRHDPRVVRQALYAHLDQTLGSAP